MLSQLFAFVILTNGISLGVCKSTIRENRPIILKIDSDQIVNTLESILSSTYIQKLAQDFAVRATDHLIKEMKNRELDLVAGNGADSKYTAASKSDNFKFKKKRNLARKKKIQKKTSSVLNEIDYFDINADWKEAQDNVSPEDLSTYQTIHPRVPKESNPVLNEHDAYILIKEPSPDGDNLAMSGELSEEEEKTARPVPVVHFSKINGRYYRRLGIQ